MNIINKFNRRVRYNIDLSELWKYYRINNNINKTSALILNILNINNEREYYKKDLIKFYEKTRSRF